MNPTNTRRIDKVFDLLADIGPIPHRAYWPAYEAAKATIPHGLNSDEYDDLIEYIEDRLDLVEWSEA